MVVLVAVQHVEEVDGASIVVAQPLQNAVEDHTQHLLRITRLLCVCVCVHGELTMTRDTLRVMRVHNSFSSHVVVTLHRSSGLS